jgi:hypothetical protein
VELIIKYFYLILIVSCLCIYSINPQGKVTNNSKYKTWISTVKEGDMLKVSANFQNNTNDNLKISYDMFSNKSGKDGKSFTTQKGTVNVEGFNSAVLSRSSVNLVKNDEYSFILTTYKNNDIIGKDSVMFRLN